jgi:prepilin-type N-terminal cleavage/methylation domain-containing protein
VLTNVPGGLARTALNNGRHLADDVPERADLPMHHGGPVLQRLRVNHDEDSGFTLVESLVGMVVISIVFSAMAAFLITAIKAQTANERRIKATQVGSKAVEDLRALPWTSLGFYTTDTGYASTYKGADTVTLAAPASGVRDSKAPLPSKTTVTVGGVAFSQTLHVVWFDDPGDGLAGADNDSNTHDAKKVIADLSWTVGTVTKDLTVTGVRAPTIDEVSPRGQGVVSPFQITTFTASPTAATLEWNGITKTAIVFHVVTTVAASQARLSFVDRNGLTTTALMTAASSNTDWTYTLPVGSGPFTTGPQSFSVRAYAPAGATADATVSVDFAVSSVTMDVSTPTITPSSVDIDSTGRNTVAITVTATATVALTSMTVTYPTKTGSATASMNLSNGSKTGTFTLAALTGSFSAGVKSWVVTANGSGTASRSASVTFVAPAPPAVTMVGLVISPSVCAHNGNGVLNRSSVVTVTMTGLATTDKVKLEFNDQTATRVNAVYSSTVTSGDRYTVTLPAGTMKWSGVTNPTVTATATRTSDATQTQRIFTVPVTFKSGNSSCPA